MIDRASVSLAYVILVVAILNASLDIAGLASKELVRSIIALTAMGGIALALRVTGAGSK